MNLPITSDQQLPPLIQVDVTGVDVTTQNAASQAYFATQSRFPDTVANPTSVGSEGGFKTNDGRSGVASIKYKMGEAYHTCHWVADDGSECGGYVDLTKRLRVDPPHPTKERIAYSFLGTQVGTKGDEKILDHRTGVISLIRRIEVVASPTYVGDVFVPAVYRVVPTEFENTQEVLTYDGTVGTQNGRGVMATFTIGDTQGKFHRNTNGGKGSYKRGGGGGGDVVFDWERFSREGRHGAQVEEVIEIWRSANDGSDESTIQVPQDCKTIVPAGLPERGNYTGYFSPSLNHGA